MIELVIDARRKDLGGFEVGRVLPFHSHRMVGPFIFLDQMARPSSRPAPTPSMCGRTRTSACRP